MKIRALQMLIRAHAKPAKIKETQAPAEVPATVSMITPPERQKEPDELRELEYLRWLVKVEMAEPMKRKAAEYTVLRLYEHFRVQFEQLQDALGQLSPENRERYAAAFVEAIRNMEAMIAENGGKEPSV